MGERPNPQKNANLKVPFVGTVSYKRLLEWIYRMGLDINLIKTADAYDVNGRDMPLNIPDIKQYAVIALGKAAGERLGRVPGLRFFTLPNPAELTKVKNLSDSLVKCKRFIFTYC